MSDSGASTAKRRATTARLFPCLGAGLAAFAVWSSTAFGAEALPAPILTGTNPASPGATLSPRIQGQAEGVQTRVIHFGAAARS